MDVGLDMDNTQTSGSLAVSFIIDQLVHPNAGTEGQLLMLMDGLRERDIAVELAVFRETDYVRDHSLNYPVHCLNVQAMKSLPSWWRMLSYLRSLKRRGVSVVHLYFNDSALMVPIVGWMLGLKVVVSRRDMGFWYTPLRLKILRLNRFFTHALIANSHAVKSNACEQEHMPLDRAHVIYNGLVQIPLFDNTEVNAGGVEIGGDEAAPSDQPSVGTKGAIKIGLVANLRKIKRINDLIQAAALLGPPQVEVHIAGSGDPQSLQRLADGLGFGQQVFFHGSVTDVRSFLSEMDICALCSESEGLSNALIEYMVFGKPIVCSAIAANQELIRDRTDGLLYPVGDVQGLSDALGELIGASDKRAEFARSARHRIQTLCDKDQMIAAHIALYQELLY
jgi:glycosyltransferase involved in cell wall biosynthesis